MEVAMTGLVQSLGNGVLIGLVYALLGLCIVIIFKASEAFNFAVGEFLVIGSFAFYVLFFDFGLPFLIALPLGLLIAGIVGAIVERFTIKPLLGRSPISMTIVTIGLWFFLRACVQLYFGNHSYSFFLELPDISLSIGNFLFLSDPIWAGILSIGTFALVILILFRTRWGLAIRSISMPALSYLSSGPSARPA
jgi:branched-chain amino acid transport system permease protein